MTSILHILNWLYSIFVCYYFFYKIFIFSCIFLFRKYREWERKRRNRLNVSFCELNTVLPDYDPAVNRTKVDIINNAASYIKELVDKNQKLMEKNDTNSLYGTYNLII